MLQQTRGSSVSQLSKALMCSQRAQQPSFSTHLALLGALLIHRRVVAAAADCRCRRCARCCCCCCACTHCCCSIAEAEAVVAVVADRGNVDVVAGEATNGGVILLDLIAAQVVATRSVRLVALCV
jgi:hypothetical protein